MYRAPPSPSPVAAPLWKTDDDDLGPRRATVNIPESRAESSAPSSVAGAPAAPAVVVLSGEVHGVRAVGRLQTAACVARLRGGRGRLDGIELLYDSLIG